MAEHDAGRPVFWEKQESETATQYAAFCAYRDMGRTRSLRKAAAIFYAEEGGQGEARGRPDSQKKPPDSGTSGQIARFKQWSSAHLWKDRAEAFDIEESRKRSLRLLEERDKMIDGHLRVAKMGLNVAAGRLAKLMQGEENLPNSVLSGFIREVTSLHRLTLGEATSKTEEVQKPTWGGPDYSQLTDEEVAFLDDIGEKLYGGG